MNDDTISLRSFTAKKRPTDVQACTFYVDDSMRPNTVFIHDKMYPVYKDGKGYYIEIKTLEGVMRGDNGDIIIKGVKGEVYPCKPDIFDLTYVR
jgi:hypothetical protein